MEGDLFSFQEIMEQRKSFCPYRGEFASGGDEKSAKCNIARIPIPPRLDYKYCRTGLHRCCEANPERDYSLSKSRLRNVPGMASR